MSLGRILYVDDEPDMVTIVNRELTRAGYEFKGVTSGKDAFELSATYKPHLIVMDLIMPEIDGAETAKLIRNQTETEDIPILFLTGTITEREEDERGINIDGTFWPVISKPFKIEELLQKISDHINN